VGYETNFSRAAQRVLDHLSLTSGIPTWLLLRTDGGTSQTLAVADPSNTLRAHQMVSSHVGVDATHRIAVPVVLPDDQPFGEVVGFSNLYPATGTIEDVTALATLFAVTLGSLAGSELTLATERRAAEVRDGLADPLTGAATRQGWEQRLRRDERFCAEFGESAAIVVIELDDLKRNNELHGHSAGDEQLRHAGLLLREVLAGRHYGARITGDRLGILMVGIGEHEVGELERALRHALSNAQISAAIGVARRLPERGLEGAVIDAEAAVLRTHSTRTLAQADANEAAVLLEAIEMGAIKAYFQPIVDLRTGEVIAIEALARWQSSEGVREPDRFLRHLQQAGLLGALFDRILDDGLEHLVGFRHIVPNLTLAVNFEFDSKPDESLLSSVIDRLHKHGLPAEVLSIELSERQTFDLPSSVRAELNAVSELGVRLMLDDFGTGFASLETLTSLPISGVKLDRRFTGQVVNGDREPVVVKAMIAMAAEAGLTVIAEGIETQLQCDRLVRLGCRLGQGYLFALPQPAESLSTVLSAPLVSTF
jgi:diguanylate cyclase (GGDEF)-like protein